MSPYGQPARTAPTSRRADIGRVFGWTGIGSLTLDNGNWPQPPGGSQSIT